MKYLLLLLWMPVFAGAQTVHVKDGKINYEEVVAVKGIDKPELYERAKKALQQVVDKNEQEVAATSTKEDEVMANGKMKLPIASDNADNMLLYTIKIKVDNGQYKYHIYKVHIAGFKNGQKVKDVSSKDLLKGMESSGDMAARTEKELNSIDMNLQKLIALIKSRINNASVSKSNQ